MPFKIIRNDITKVRASAIVNTANPRPVIGSGTDSAIYEAAGRERLLEARNKIGPIEPGCAVREALADGSLTPERWETYTRLEKENSWSKIKKNEMMMNVAMARRRLGRQRKKR